MDHIRQFDWCNMNMDSDVHFLTENDIDSSCIEKILRNKFRDPLISSSSEDEKEREVINWDEVFSARKNNNKYNRMYVPGLRPIPQYPKLSCLSKEQHYRCLKVICHDYPDVLQLEMVPRPTKTDHQIFETVKNKIEQEQKEFKEWAKTLWANTHCLQALRPKPLIEQVYDAEFKMKAAELQSLPKNYEMVAHIPLRTDGSSFDIVHEKDLIKVNPSELPEVHLPEMFTSKVNILQNSVLPEPCAKHPCRFILPSESMTTILPLREVHKELAQYAIDNGAKYLASESALRAIVQTDHTYVIPVTVCGVLDDDGDTQYVSVIGNEFSINRESSLTRTYKAFRHLLLNALITKNEKSRVNNIRKKKDKENKRKSKNNNENVSFIIDDDSDNDEATLVMDIEPYTEEMSIKSEPPSEAERTEPTGVNNGEDNNESNVSEVPAHVSEMFTCTCGDTPYERPHLRSYRKWQVRNKTNNEVFDLVVHCSHKLKTKTGEFILEPIPEYQIDLGASEQSIDKIKSLALALHLRKNTSVVNVRIDGPTGDLVTFENMTLSDLTEKHDDIIADVSNSVHSVLNHLQGLLPGSYLLKHEPEHGANALLYVSRSVPARGQCLTLTLDSTQLHDPDEAKCLKRPPVLTPVLLPAHKLRKILPLLFSPFPYHVAPEPRKPATRQKTPPKAIKWPKRKKKKKATVAE